MNNNDWLDIDVLEDYLDGKLDARAMHRVERLSLEDPFVSEALAGLSLSPKRVQSLSLLQKQLKDRVAQKPIEKKRWQITSQRLSIAAAAAVLFVTVSMLFWMRESSNREKVAANAPKKVEIAIAATTVDAVAPKLEVEKVIAAAKKNSHANAPQQIYSALSGKVAGVTLQKADKKSVMGVVIGEDKLPIVGASVKLIGSTVATVTDNKGEFSLKLDSLVEDQKLSVAYLGYIRKEVKAKIDEKLAVELKEDNSALNEVVITGVGKRSSSAESEVIIIPTAKEAKAKRAQLESGVPQGAEPVGGLTKFEQYVLNNNRLLLDKKLTGRSIFLTFELDAEGRPFNIKTTKTFNMIPNQTKEEEDEAIRLLKEGPKWVSSSNPQMTIKSGYVRIKF